MSAGTAGAMLFWNYPDKAEPGCNCCHCAGNPQKPEAEGRAGLSPGLYPGPKSSRVPWSDLFRMFRFGYLSTLNCLVAFARISISHCYLDQRGERILLRSS